MGLGVGTIPRHGGLAVLARCCPPNKVQVGKGRPVVEGGRRVHRGSRRVRVGVVAVVGMVRSMGAGLRLCLRRATGHGSPRRTQHAREGLWKEVGRAGELQRRLPVTMGDMLRVVVVVVVLLLLLLAVLVLLPPAGRTAVDGVVVGAAAGRRRWCGLGLHLLGGGGTQCWAGGMGALLRYIGIHQARPVQRVGPLVHHEIACGGIHV